MNSQLRQALTEKRNQLASFAGIPRYMILTNAVIDRIVVSEPKSLADLADIKGLGEKKISQYGQVILDLVLRYTTSTQQQEPVAESVLSVAEYLAQLNSLLKTQTAAVQGEITEISVRGSFAYLTLKDREQEALLKCFIYMDLLPSVQEGTEVQVFGYPEIYPPYGRISFRIRQMTLVGEGALKLAFEALKRKLTEAGLFDPARKKPLPTFVKSVGLVTSDSGEAIHDCLTHLDPRGFSVYFHQVRVEGIHAVEEIVAAIRSFSEASLPLDVVVLTRGGGSLENLQAFNTEAVARAIAASRIPVLVAVGHENDVTIADLVADVRASTPTDAGKILSRPWQEARIRIESVSSVLQTRFVQNLTRHQQVLQETQLSLISRFTGYLMKQKETLRNNSVQLLQAFSQLLLKFNAISQSFRQSLHTFTSRLNLVKHNLADTGQSLYQRFAQTVIQTQKTLQQEKKLLEAHDPLVKLRQGYSFVTKNGKIVRNALVLTIGDRIDIRFHIGTARSLVEETKGTL